MFCPVLVHLAGQTYSSGGYEINSVLDHQPTRWMMSCGSAKSVYFGIVATYYLSISYDMKFGILHCPYKVIMR